MRFISFNIILLLLIFNSIAIAGKVTGIVKGVDEEPVPFACVSLKNIAKKWSKLCPAEFIVHEVFPECFPSYHKIQ